MSSRQSSKSEPGEESSAASPVGANEDAFASWELSDGDNDGRPKDKRSAKRMRTFQDASQESSRALPATNSPEYRHNHDNSRFHQLPAELMFEIIDHVSINTTSLLCMQLVARDFYPLLEAPLIAFKEERDAFKAALRRDDLAWFSRLEQLKGLNALPQAVCSACKTRHDKAQFTQQELAKGPHQRRCTSAVETVIMNGCHNPTLNEIYECTLDTCRQHGIAAVYISKSLTNQTRNQAGKPILETIIAHVTRPRRLDVTFHFRHSAPCKGEHVYDETVLEPAFASAELVCPQLQAKLLCCETITHDQKVPERFKDHTAELYDRWGYQWYNCICRSPTCVESLWSQYTREREAQDVKEMVMSIRRSYGADKDYAGPDWHRQIVLKLAHQQNELNAENSNATGIRLYEAKEKGKWTWEDLLEKVAPSHG